MLPIGCTPRVARSGRWPDAIGPPPRPEDQVRFSTKSPSPAQLARKGANRQSATAQRVFPNFPRASIRCRAIIDTQPRPNHKSGVANCRMSNAKSMTRVCCPTDSRLPETQRCRLTVALRFFLRSSFAHLLVQDDRSTSPLRFEAGCAVRARCPSHPILFCLVVMLTASHFRASDGPCVCRIIGS